MKRHPGNAGFTLIELLIVVAIIGILAAIAIPALIRARMSANEASAIATLRAIYSAQVTYSSVCGNSSYAAALPTLAMSAFGGTDPFLPPDLTSGPTIRKGGYTITLNNGGFVAGSPDCNGSPTAVGYYASAAPISTSTGGRSFAMSHAGAIFFLSGATAPNPAEAGSPIR